MNDDKFKDYYDPVLSREAINVLTGLSTMFVNSECIVVEYVDIINMPYFVWLYMLCLKSNDSYEESFPKLKELSELSPESVLEFYINRENQNIIMDIIPNDVEYDIDEMNHYLMNQVNKYENCFMTDIELSFVRAIKDIVRNKFAKKVVFFYPEKCDYVIDDIHSKFGNSNIIDIRFGDFEEIIKDCSLDATYVLSDANKVVMLDDMNRLQQCTVMLPYEYGYNYVDLVKDEFILSEDYFKEKNIHFTKFSAL